MKIYAFVKDGLVENISIADQDWEPSAEWLEVTNQRCGIGDTYNETAGVFVAPQPWPSWVLDEDFTWVAPTPAPADGKAYSWDESSTSWIEMPTL